MIFWFFVNPLWRVTWDVTHFGLWTRLLDFISLHFVCHTAAEQRAECLYRERPDKCTNNKYQYSKIWSLTDWFWSAATTAIWLRWISRSASGSLIALHTAWTCQLNCPVFEQWVDQPRFSFDIWFIYAFLSLKNCKRLEKVWQTSSTPAVAMLSCFSTA